MAVNGGSKRLGENIKHIPLLLRESLALLHILSCNCNVTKFRYIENTVPVSKEMRKEEKIPVWHFS
jgi:hypothetical protein